MSIYDVESKVRELRQLQALIEEAEAEAEAIKDAAKKEAGTYSTAKKQSQMSDSFLQFASFAKSGAYNLSNYYAVSMLNMLV